MKVIISTPSQQQIFKDFKVIKLNGEAGELEILPHHENFVALIEGSLKIKLADKMLEFTVSDHTLFQFDNEKSVANIVASSCILK
jgi:F0F1-type ATP synthase epsilon subunit